MGDISFGFLEKPPEPLRYGAQAGEGLSDYGKDVYLPIAQFVNQEARVLDVGCGTGDFAYLLCKEKKADVIGIEQDGERASYASNALGIRVLNADFNSVNTDDLGKFDTVIFADILEHLVDPATTLKKVRSLLRPDGFVIVSLPNIAHWSIRSGLLFGQFNYTATGILDATHLRFFTYGSMKRFFALTGFQILSTSFSLGSTLPIYSRFPWKLLSRSHLRRLLKILVYLFPKLFSCQFLIKAKPVIL